MSEIGGEQLATGQDEYGNPFVAWQQPDGSFRRAWIAQTRGPAGARELLVVSTDVLDGEPITQPSISPIFHDADDWDILNGYVRSAISPPPG
jgi:hypothetical protein